MRVASLLPMLLLWLSSLSAQNNCSIFDLTATVVQVNPANCQYFVSLDFEHSGTTNQFSVIGNGTLYGPFAYGQQPVLLGPFNGNPNAPTQWGFVVTDLLIPTCSADIGLLVPPCGNGGICNIENLFVQPGGCDPTGASYELTVNFQVQGAVNGFFEVFANGGASLGIFPLAGLPLQIPAFPTSGNPKDIIKVCISGQPNCCETLEFVAPPCAGTPCAIVDLVIQTGDCTSDSTYKIWIDFDVVAPNNLDSFALWNNGQLQGFFALNQLPLTQEITWGGANLDEIKVCLANANVVCCRTRPIQAPDCLSFIPCGIKDLVVKADSCTSDTTFLALINFTVNDTSAVDSFKLWANGTFWGTYGMDQLPLAVDSFPWNNLIFSQIKICTGNDPGCCKEYQFLAPACLPFGPCEITDIFLRTGDCTSDSTYNITLNFNATNPGDGSFAVFLGNQLLDTFSLSAAPLTLEVPWNGQSGDFVRICILDSNATPGAAGCCRVKQFQVPTCLLPCNIFDVVVDPGNCNNDGTYLLHLNFEYTNPGNNFFEVWGNGTYLGLFALDSLPLVIPNFPSNGNPADIIKICINDHPDCCETLEFQGPVCDPPCSIFDLTFDVGDCNLGDSTYNLFIDFEAVNPGNDSFEVWGNGVYLGLFALADLPLKLTNVPSNGNAIDVVRICINDHPDCCEFIEFQGPNCGQNCKIFDVTLDPGDCNPGDSTFNLFIDFEALNPGNDSFEVWGNGVYLGLFALADLPLQLTNFPANGNAIDIIRICINDHPDCCKFIEFQGPDCLQPCHISDVSIDPGACSQNGDSFSITLDFEVTNPGNALFEVWGNGVYLGLFPLAGLPLNIPNFPSNGNAIDIIKICINDHPDCCETIEFQGPNCNVPCDIFDLTVVTGACNVADSTYEITVDFQVQNPNSNTFGVWANGQFFGTYNLAQLPLTIPNFPWDGNGPKDVIRVCLTNNNGALFCCSTLEFPTPNCFGNANCDVKNLQVDTGNCTSDSTYQLFINFQVVNPPSNLFSLFANGQLLGIFNLNNLPLNIQDFPWGGAALDEIKVCFTNAPGGQGACCAELAYPVPGCLPMGDCKIFDVVLDPGDCNPATTTYPLFLDFEVNNPGSAFFDVWGNGTYLGNFPLAGLPMMIPNFPSNGNAIDAIKICITNHPDCCKTVAFQGPPCGNINCDIVDFTLETGVCTSDSTYHVKIDFEVLNPLTNNFQVWANGQLLGVFMLNQLPLLIPDFPWSGGNTDEIKVCIVSNNIPGMDLCCITRTFQVPDCLNNDCNIYDLVVVRTPCLCGQFFVALTFEHENGGSGGFDIFGNGNNYGNFPYDTLQPIILGPFIGDGTTMYEFSVVDHNQPDLCGDDVNIGKVECLSPVVDPGAGNAFMTMSPNPTANWLNVSALLENGAQIGQSDVEIYATDGRLVQRQTVVSGGNFQLNVSALPSGLYRLVLLSDAGRLEGTFAKQ